MPRKKTLLCLIGIKLYEHLQEMKWQNIWDKLCIYARSFFFFTILIIKCLICNSFFSMSLSFCDSPALPSLQV